MFAVGHDSALVDTIRVGGRIEAINRAPGWTSTVTTTEAGETVLGSRRKLDSGPVIDVRGDHAYIECSVPKVTRGVNYPALPLGEALSALPGLVDAASEFVRFRDPVADLVVNRLDVVRDFDCGDPLGVSGVISALARVPVMGRAGLSHFFDGSSNRAQTVRVATKSAGGGTIYDKGQESGRVEAAGIVRFEARERQATLRRAQLRVVRDLEPRSVGELGRRRFEWAGFDAQMFGPEDWFERVINAPGTPYSKIMVLGYGEVLRHLGAVGKVFTARRSDYRWRRAIRSFGVPAVRTMRLDYLEGLVAA